MITKAEEIKALQSLKDGGYFADQFTADQIDAMCANIRNDFPIMQGIDMFEHSEVAKERARLTAEVQRLKDTDCDAALAVLRKAEEHGDESMDIIAGMLVGQTNCLRLKLGHGIALTEKDRASLLDIIEHA